MNGVARGSSKKRYTDSLSRGLWEIPGAKTILKGHGGQRGCPARLISTTAPSKAWGAV